MAAAFLVAGGLCLSRLRAIQPSLRFASGPPCWAWRPARAVLAGRTQGGGSSPRPQQTETAPQGCRFRLFGGAGGIACVYSSGVNRSSLEIKIHKYRQKYRQRNLID